MQMIHTTDEFIDAQSHDYIRLSDRIWGLAELGYVEFESSDAHIEYLERAGFEITRGVGGIPTAFIAEAGTSGPIIGILGEFDALSGLSQESQALECRLSTEIANGNGHGCGHHLLGTSAHLAAAAVKDYLAKEKLPGIVRFYGCPAEECGGGKTFMARAGLFDDLDAALTWHPGWMNGVKTFNFLAAKQAFFRFTGVAAHAGTSPHLGRSALDAVELMNIGTNFLREHMLPDARVHYAITDSGGTAPNVVQAHAEVMYMVRGPRNRDVAELFERVEAIAQGAALMTGCKVEQRFDVAFSNVLQNGPLNELMHKHLVRLGTPAYDDRDLAFADAMQKTARQEEVDAIGRMLTDVWRNPKPLFDTISRLDTEHLIDVHGSTDVGDVSWITPTVQCMTACFAFGTTPHSWQWVAQGKSSIAHKGMVLAAKTIAATAIDLFRDPSLIEAAKQDLVMRRAGEPYVNPIPDDVQPPLQGREPAKR
ncbi:amidohydrolase [Burkholderia pseudomultivorans]|uniref:M20 family metallopeptidase n=1 Tax=Burkholderia pseudomultivorans TaxID=1207504 RepID=UPI0007555AD4|nr:M20 family metallopeptidase [Burkholderia pseudomultivorans]AOI89809.1 amidohydrolase [Burkholderia pseudomultivorans]KVC49000.1 amidohydrolase [Burkholderia pseudomultivorans]